MIDDIKRLAGPYTSAGQKDLAFGFLIFEPTDVYVAKAESADSVITHTLSYGSDYTVSMNSDQSATPGGTVTLTTPIAEGQVVVVGSAIAYTQTTQLTNFSRFPPEIINTALDRIVVQIQQLVEKIGRVVSVPETSTTTPEEMLDRLLSAASDAAASASSAASSATSAANAQKAAEVARDLAQQYASQNAHAVVYDAQTLTTTQQAQARKNIGAISAAEAPAPNLTPYLTKADAASTYLGINAKAASAAKADSATTANSAKVVPWTGVSGKPQLIPGTGDAGTITTTETVVAATTVSDTSARSMSLASGGTLTVNNGSANKAWITVVALAGSATISLGSSWSWSGSAPTLAKGLVTLAWYGTFGVANFTKFGD